MNPTWCLMPPGIGMEAMIAAGVEETAFLVVLQPKKDLWT